MEIPRAELITRVCEFLNSKYTDGDPDSLIDKILTLLTKFPTFFSCVFTHDLNKKTMEEEVQTGTRLSFRGGNFYLVTTEMKADMQSCTRIVKTMELHPQDYLHLFDSKIPLDLDTTKYLATVTSLLGFSFSLAFAPPPPLASSQAFAPPRTLVSSSTLAPSPTLAPPRTLGSLQAFAFPFLLELVIKRIKRKFPLISSMMINHIFERLGIFESPQSMERQLYLFVGTPQDKTQHNNGVVVHCIRLLIIALCNEQTQNNLEHVAKLLEIFDVILEYRLYGVNYNSLHVYNGLIYITYTGVFPSGVLLDSNSLRRALKINSIVCIRTNK